MSLDVWLKDNWCDHCGRGDEVYEGNITHNLTSMAEEAGCYQAMWRPDDAGIQSAHELVPILSESLGKLTSNPGHFTALNPENGWGSYEILVEFVRDYLRACREYPEAHVDVWR